MKPKTEQDFQHGAPKFKGIARFQRLGATDIKDGVLVFPAKNKHRLYARRSKREEENTA